LKLIRREKEKQRRRGIINIIRKKQGKEKKGKKKAGSKERK
jgi:hypothetical protein